MSDTSSLRQLPFIDLYMRLDAEDIALYRPTSKGKGKTTVPVPIEFKAVIAAFIDDIKERMEGADGSIDHDGLRCRLSRQKMADDSIWVCARRINTVVPDLTKLGFHQNIYNHMHSLGQRDGLILVSGATGHGKTTTATALLADYLKAYGGTAVTIEDPVEFLMKGRHGEAGYCFQVEVEKDEDWATNLKRSLRWGPRYIFVGEIRTPKAAEQLLRAATTGHTVITTVHAGSPEEALLGILFLAEQAMGPGCSDLLAAGLTALIYQSITDSGPYIRYLFTEENSSGDPVRSLIRENKIGMITTYIDRIQARLSGTNKPAPAMSAAQAQMQANKFDKSVEKVKG
jgi:twitching motility protein PilT